MVKNLIKIFKFAYFFRYETLPISVELPENLSQASDINVSVFDWDQLDGDDFLGRFSIPLTKINDQQPQVPTWFPIYAKNPKAPEGEILASFQLYCFSYFSLFLFSQYS